MTRLSRKETRRLIALSQSGDQRARERLIEANLPLVKAIVPRFSGTHRSFDDLFQSGSIGLMKAIDTFDLSYDVALSTHAVPYIIGEMRKFLREDRSVKVSRSLFHTGRRVRTARDELTQKLGRSPTPSEVAYTLNISEEDVIASLDAVAQPKSLNERMSSLEDEGDSLADRLPSEESDMDVTQRLAFMQLLRQLDDDERHIVFLRYYKQLSQAEVARFLGKSQPTVSRMESRMRARLKALWPV